MCDINKPPATVRGRLDDMNLLMETDSFVRTLGTILC